MISYIIRRSLQIIPTLLVVITFLFFLLSALPGDVALLAGNPRMQDAGPEVLEELREEWGLNRPLHIQYFDYLTDLFRGDLGYSFRSQEKVAVLIGHRIVPTVQLALLAGAVSLSLGVILGFLAAIFHGTLIDFFLMIVAVVGISAPSFWIGVILMYVFAVTFSLLPPSGYGSIYNLILPTLALAIRHSALIARTTRASVLDIIKEDYVRTARAKGISEIALNVKHVFRNAILPIMTIGGLEVGTIFAGTIIIEKLFSWPGLGNLLINSVTKRDIPTAQGAVLVYFSVFIFVNFFTDIMYAYADPTITYD
ncbi:MAG: ABC transporter permease [Candidatus Bipolaricaulota bacterium]